MNKKNQICNFKEYFYIVNYPENEKELCKMEMNSLFHKEFNKKYLFSHKYINPSRSPFIKHSISVIYKENSLSSIIERIKKDKLAFNDFKVCYIKSEDLDVSYNERLKSAKDIGFVITGFPDIHNPKITLGISKVHDNWIFGIYEKNDYKWHSHDNKPNSYSNALSIKVSRALVNIAMEDNFNLKLVDPCCGVGTVVIEALDLGFNVKGYELSKPIAKNARDNIEFFGYKRDIIKSFNMHDIKENFDVCILDIPYGLFSPITEKEQIELIKTARRITKKLVIITFENMDNIIKECDFKIIDKCCVSKNNFKRYISICI
ncbi:MAG: SAM-dependent methyltransferase [Clostridium perfringens]|nr:SAM-dependent methyltransferase [Clostridium perfringens]